MTILQAVLSFYRVPATPSMPRPTVLSFLTDETGQDLIEYALVAALVGLGAVVSLRGLTNKIDSTFNAVSNQLTASY